MRVALIHYHLQSGGVTRILCHQQQALRDRGINAVILIGKEPDFSPPGAFRVIPGLQYEALRPQISPQDLAAQMQAAAREALGGAPDLWHAHNHSLGKNLILPPALQGLAVQGECLLLQIHDFAEDGRPCNYRTMLDQMAGCDPGQLCRLLYPQGEQVHYAVLNSRDYLFLHNSGLSTEQLHLLPNPVALAAPQEEARLSQPGQHALWLYPTRAIRRKNLGEFLLWSILAPAETVFATTAGPENPAEWARYQRWKGVAAELRLPVSFEQADQREQSFVTLLQSASCVITTSVAEGFGMAFLEPWSLGVPVCGRDLPEITDAFRRDGIVLPWSYERLDVPLDWLGRERVLQAAIDGLQRNLATYGRRPQEGDVERLAAAWIRDDRVDFGRLNENMQESVLRDLACAQYRGEELRPAVLPLPETIAKVVEKNRLRLVDRYNLAQYGETMEGIYRRLVASTPSSIEALNGATLLDRFLAPERLSLLRVD